MIEPSGMKISLPPNRQGKVPGMGSDQMACVQSISDGAPNDQAQDDAGFGSVSTAGIGENVPGRTTRLSPCAKAAQDAGSHTSMVPFNGGAPINLGSPGWEGSRAVSAYNSGTMDADAADLENTSRSVAGNTDPHGKAIKPGRGDIGVASGMLFPGIIE